MKSLFDFEQTLPKELECALELIYERYTKNYDEDTVMIFVKDAITDYLMKNGYGFLTTQKLKKGWLDEFISKRNV